MDFNLPPKQNAEILLEKYTCYRLIQNFNQKVKSDRDFNAMKGWAIICIEQMISITPMYTGNLNPKWKYLNEVKTEIEKYEW